MARSVGRRRLADRAATWFFTLGGGVAVVLILGMLAFLVWEVVPLFVPASAEVSALAAPLREAAQVCLPAEKGDHALLLDHSARVQRLDLESGAVVAGEPLFPDVRRVSSVPGSREVACWLGEAGLGVVRFEESTAPSSEALRGWELRRAQIPALIAEGAPFCARLDADGGLHAVYAGSQAQLHLRHLKQAENQFTGEMEVQQSAADLVLSAPAKRLWLSGDGRTALATLVNGAVVFIRDATADKPSIGEVNVGNAEVTAIIALFGEQSFVLGQADGTISVWFPTRGGAPGLEQVRQFPELSAAVTQLVPSWRDKGFMAVDAGGLVSLCHSTSEREVWRGQSGVQVASSAALAVKGDAALILAAGTGARLTIDNPHPDVSFSAWFTPVRYEGYEESSLTWQSSSGNDDYEPKLSLWPLIFGTLKGTLFALLLAVPLGVGAAIFSSQFLSPRTKATVKPIVEMMASLPSVVLGFIAGLWLAPRIERVLPGMVLIMVLLPLGALFTGAVLRGLARRGRVGTGAALVVHCCVAAAAVALALWLSPLVEIWAFGGDARVWLREVFGLTYDQRNALVVALGMGFAVIPLIYSLADEALTNVPRTLVLGSLALGADRWETVRRVVLPAAGPGVFAAIMVGFGRALGETMIVLMATGNTPLLSLSPFNGLRTLSANIATEIPEAPVGGSLYRTLFFSVLLLFVLNLCVNSVADRVRENLRRKHGAL